MNPKRRGRFRQLLRGKANGNSDLATFAPWLKLQMASKDDERKQKNGQNRDMEKGEQKHSKIRRTVYKKINN